MESAKQMDSSLLQGRLTNLVETTKSYAHRGLDTVREHLPAVSLPGADEGGYVPALLLASTKFEKVCCSLRSLVRLRH